MRLALLVVIVAIAMARWRDGAMARWRDGAMARWRDGAMGCRKLGVTSPVVAEHHGADLSPLRNAGVPVVDLARDATPYFDIHHTADDTLDKVEPADLDQVVAVTSTFTFAVADSVADFGRIPEDKPK